jgi:DNA recombination-dependent growth factor C
MPEDTEEVMIVLKEKSKKGHLIKPQIQKLTANNMRMLIKTAKIVTFTKLYVKEAK